ncbi:hypothetical protein KIW84_014444 [Lathyrus oleraceus]|uniref:CCHC-type domain-containing protein n=1 Tax=Pisum sativum TaxID=3888 RepID=A0A9D5BND6_PEA|nr:hypothetical protein KIW84_014444 [Pisum sativum]
MFRGGRGRGRGRNTVDRAIIECYKCHQLGHYQNECPEWEKKANYAELEEEEELLLMSYLEKHQANREEVWFLNSGCSNHMTGCKDWFFELEEGLNRSVKLGNETRMSVGGKGSVKVQVNGATQVIPEVYYVPELKNNLLSLGQLQERGLAILIRDGTCKVYHPKKGAIMETNMSGNRMFFLLTSKLQKNTMCLKTEENTEEREDDMACPPPTANSSPSGSSSSSASGGNSTPPSPFSSLPSPIPPSPSRSIERKVVAGPRVRRTPVYLADYVTGEGEDEEESLSVMLLIMMTENDPVKFEEAVKDKVLATILTLWLTDKSGRRLLLIVSSSAMALSLLVVSISFYLKEYISPDSDLYATLSLVSVAGVVVMVIAFSLGLGAMPWIIMSEILPINIKGLAGSFATLANWFFSWLVTLTANLLLDWSSGGTLTIYTAVCVFTAGFVAIWVPETKGKTLEEIQQFFR